MNVFTTSFGNNYHTERAGRLLNQWQGKDFSDLPSIEIVSSSVLGSANTAYAASKKTIYISDAFLTTASSGSLVSTLLKKYGHYIYSCINNTGSLGYEGAIFSELVRGGDSYLMRLYRH